MRYMKLIRSQILHSWNQHRLLYFLNQYRKKPISKQHLYSHNNIPAFNDHNFSFVRFQWRRLALYLHNITNQTWLCTLIINLVRS